MSVQHGPCQSGPAAGHTSDEDQGAIRQLLRADVTPEVQRVAHGDGSGYAGLAPHGGARPQAVVEEEKAIEEKAGQSNQPNRPRGHNSHW